MKKQYLINLSIITTCLVIFSGCQNNDKVENQKQITKIEQHSNNKEKSKKEVIKIEKKIVKEDKKEKEEKEIGNPSKGQKIFTRKLKKACGVNGGVIAKKHTQNEWKEIIKEGKLANTISSLCNGAKVKDKYLLDIGSFFIQYANDSGNIPSC
jgi:hypothetical protein